YDGEHARENRTANEKMGKVHGIGWVDCSGVFKKLHAPNSNLQRSSNPQTPNRPLWGADIWNLEFGISLELGAWDLELFHSRPFVFAVALCFNVWRLADPRLTPLLPAA